MATIRKQFYGIKFPFTANNTLGFCIDLNNDIKDKIASQIVHTILTPKRTRLRMPEFGTDLAKFIFEPNDEMTWESVKSEITTAVSNYVPNTKLTNIEIVTPEEEDNSLYLDLTYSVEKNGIIENNRMGVKLI